MILDFSNKTALVCGSSQGIGEAVAKELATLGANVVLFARNQEKLEEVVRKLDSHENQKHQVITADFSIPNQVKEAIDDFLNKGNSIDILINNTGGPKPGPANLASSDEYLTAFNAHLITSQTLVQALLPGMKNAENGRIINIISTSVKQPLNGLGVSNTIRGAMASWAKSLANELGQFGITVNNVLPGATATNRLESIISNKANKQGLTLEQIRTNEKKIIPANRFAKPEEIAYAVAFLASPSADYINGINLPVDGGRTGSL